MLVLILVLCLLSAPVVYEMMKSYQEIAKENAMLEFILNLPILKIDCSVPVKDRYSNHLPGYAALTHATFIRYDQRVRFADGSVCLYIPALSERVYIIKDDITYELTTSFCRKKAKAFFKKMLASSMKEEISDKLINSVV